MAVLDRDTRAGVGRGLILQLGGFIVLKCWLLVDSFGYFRRSLHGFFLAQWLAALTLFHGP
jgi:hypothetical protein